jgi:Leucine-rich repeat (LRR) protein
MAETHKLPKPKRRWFRFRLRTLLIMVTFLSVPLVWVGCELDQRRREKAVVAWIVELGGQVYFHSGNQNGSHPLVISDERNWWEQTKDNWLGEWVQAVLLDNTQVIDLSPLAELKNLKRLDLWSTEVTDLSPLAELKMLKELELQQSQVSDLSPLFELKNLSYLGLMTTPVSDKQVQELQQALPNCTIDF